MKNFGYIRLLLIRLGLVLMMFTLCRIVFYLLNIKYFPTANLGHFFSGIVFDIAVTSMYFAPFILVSLLHFVLSKYKFYTHVVAVLYHVPAALCIALNALDFQFYKFTSKRSTFDFFEMMSYGKDAENLIPSMMKQYWFIVLTGLALIALSFWLYRRTRRIEKNISGQHVNWKAGVIWLVCGMGFFFLTGRMSLGVRPLNLINAADFAESENIPLVLNTPFTMIKTINEPKLPDLKYFPEEQATQLYNPVEFYPANDTLTQQPNVIIFMMESVGHEYMGSLTGKKTYTPFLDSLLGESLAFENGYANGKRSIEAAPSFTASLPTLMDNPFISSSYSNNKVESLARVLKKAGYSTSFYHGATNGSMAFDSYTKAAGFEKYYGRTEFGDDRHHDGTWGIFDEEFFLYMCNNLNKEKQPFFCVQFTLTSHSPYPLPERYKNVFTGGPTPMHNCIRYTDYSFRRFFNEAKKQPWFKNTLFIFAADHTSDSEEPFYQTAFGRYKIPIFFYKYGSNLKGRSKKIAQQIDIMPSVLDYVGINAKAKCWGKSVFRDGYRFSVQYVNGLYQMIDSVHVIQFNGERVIAMFDKNKDPYLQNDILDKNTPLAEEKLKSLKALLQQYFYSMQYNKMTAE